jgi:hypothetical protein
MSKRGLVEISGAETLDFAVSPRTSRIAFSVAVEGGERLYVRKPAGDSLHLYDSPVSIGGLTWGPDESTLTFVEHGADDSSRVRMLDARSGRVSTILVLNEPHMAAEPSWSSDGRWLAIEAQPTERLRGMTVYVRDSLDGSVMLVDPLDEPEPKSACPRFSPRRPLLAYTYTPLGALDSVVMLFNPSTGDRRSVDAVGINDPLWSEGGKFLLAVSHSSICATDLVRIEPGAGTVETLWRSKDHLSPLFLDSVSALFVERACLASEEIPTEAGDLWHLSMRTGDTKLLARDIFSAAPIRSARPS